MSPDDLRASAWALGEEDEHFDRVVDHVGDAEVVLIGEASHGTHEFYRDRALITRRLIEERGFGAVVAEADWPDAYRVHRYVRGEGNDQSAEASLRDFERFPTWMWRNVEVAHFVAWLHQHNQAMSTRRQVGFYGMDLYSLYRSIERVLAFLEDVDPGAAQRARHRYGCFGYFGERAELYGQAAGLGLSPSCEQAAVRQLLDMRERAAAHVDHDGMNAIDEQFFAEQNALVVRNAEAYYRSMFNGRVNTWNMRDRHMVQTCRALRKHLARSGQSSKVVMWAHNSHLGDARATEWASVGQLNVGQLMREQHGDDCMIVGFTTHSGSVTAATEWDGPAERKRVQPSLPDSWERKLHDVGRGDFGLLAREAAGPLDELLLHRAIGVVYRPSTERASHYFASRLGRQYDVILHRDETRALEPLERWPRRARREPAETAPTGL